MLKCPFCGTSYAGGTNFCTKCGRSIQGLTGRLDAESILEDRYVITGLLGRGGMGAVYQAVDLRLNNNLVAVKEMSTAALGPGQLEKALKAFKREASMLIKLRHPSLPRVSDFFSAGEDMAAALWFVGSLLQDRSAMPSEALEGQHPDGLSDVSLEEKLEIPAAPREYYPDGEDDCGFYAGSDKYVDLSIGADQVKEILGEPQREIQTYDEYYGEGIDFYYPGLSLAFRPDCSGSLKYTFYSIRSTAYMGPRGIRVGDRVESVLQKFPHEDVDREVIDEFAGGGIAGRSDRLLYHVLVQETSGETLHKYGLAHYEGDTEVINSIDLVYGIPNSGFFILLGFEIEKELVVEIYSNVGID